MDGCHMLNTNSLYRKLDAIHQRRERSQQAVIACLSGSISTERKPDFKGKKKLEMSPPVTSTGRRW